MARLATLDDLRRHAVARTLFPPTTLAAAIAKLGFVQADPIRAPARAQDLTLRHRVDGHRAGDLERHYATLAIEEDFFVNYGFVPRAVHNLMHPRSPHREWSEKTWGQAQDVLAFVRAQGEVHPRVVDAQFQQGRVKNWFGGSSSATTQLLDSMHHRGLLRVARRDAGVRIYAARAATPEAADDAEGNARHDALVDVVVNTYAPLPAPSLGQLLSYLSRGVPQWRDRRGEALRRARSRLASATVCGVDWFWPAGEDPRSPLHVVDEQVRLLAPFDPIVWDRRRFALLWGWDYRFEAYTPPAKRKLGYYALPVLWRGAVIGWANVTFREGQLDAQFGFVGGAAPDEAAFSAACEQELARMRTFLAVTD